MPSISLKSLIDTIICTGVLHIATATARPLRQRNLDQVFYGSEADAINVFDGVGRGSDVYRQYTGNGGIGWPAMSEWVSFQQMFDANAELMKTSCTNLGMSGDHDTTEEEIGHMYHAIQNAATLTGVDHRFILAVIMQESLGCVRVYTTFNSHSNPGLMQDHAGVYSCNPASRGVSDQMMHPCPAEQIYGMIRDGAAGTTSGDGLAGYLNAVVARAASFGVSGMTSRNSQVYYQAARFYNSGSCDYNELEVGYSSRRCYASDIANRLTGWIFAPKQCFLDG